MSENSRVVHVFWKMDSKWIEHKQFEKKSNNKTFELAMKMLIIHYFSPQELEMVENCAKLNVKSKEGCCQLSERGQ